MINRRSVLKLLAGGAVGTMLTPMPYKLLYDAAYWTQNWSWIPRLKYGENAFIPAVSKICPSGSGLLIRTVAGRPVRALGNPDNILSQGNVSALQASETQLACAPSRVKSPLVRTSDGAYIETSWEEALATLAAKISEAGSSVACVSGDKTSSVNDLYSSFLAKVNSSDFYFMPSDEQAAQAAWKNMGGSGRLAFDTENADYIFSVGANYLENWGPVVYNRKIFNEKRPTNGTKTLTLTYAGAAQTNTAACADYSLIAKPNSELTILLGIANYLIKNGKSAGFTDYANFADLVSTYTSEKVASLTGLSQAKFEESLAELLKAKSPLIIVGSEANQGMGVVPFMAMIACNMLLGVRGFKPTAQLKALPFQKPAFNDSMSYEVAITKNFVSYSQNVASDKTKAPQVLMLHQANPVYALPKNVQVSELMNKAGFVVSFASFMSESALQSDLILPLSLGFESFDDVYTPYGSAFVNYAVGQPAVEPAYKTQAAADILLALAQGLGMEFSIANAAELLQAKADALGADMDSLIEGISFTSNEVVRSSSLSFNTYLISRGVTEYENKIIVAINAMRGIGTAETGIPPFSTKIMTNDQLIGKYMVAQLNKTTADTLGVKNGSMVNIANDSGSVKAIVAIYEGIQNNCILLPYGLGHTAFDDFSINIGDNVINLTSVVAEASTDYPMWSPMYATVQKV